MFGHTIGNFQKGFTLIELPVAIAIIGVLEVAFTQLVALDVVRIAPPTVAGGQPQECAATLSIFDKNGDPLAQNTITMMGDGSVHSIYWMNKSSTNSPSMNKGQSNKSVPVYAVVSEATNSPSGPLVPAVQSCTRNEIFATMSVKDGVDGKARLVLPAQLLPAVQ